MASATANCAPDARDGPRPAARKSLCWRRSGRALGARARGVCACAGAIANGARAREHGCALNPTARARRRCSAGSAPQRPGNPWRRPPSSAGPRRRSGSTLAAPRASSRIPRQDRGLPGPSAPPASCCTWPPREAPPPVFAPPAPRPARRPPRPPPSSSPPRAARCAPRSGPRPPETPPATRRTRTSRRTGGPSHAAACASASPTGGSGRRSAPGGQASSPLPRCPSSAPPALST
mmetsp:Transcript_7017/g.19393  ORF Transcript_7017/g.19393 Transcript_7017/m.19393 type:complete len:235 (+) Transcript_7017:86-790(+)